ncbi:MAG: PKD domain-containing protein, partial [Sphingomonadales bacterium]
MKHLLLLFVSSLCFIQLSFAQVTGFAITGLILPPNFNAVSCDQTVNIGFSALSPAPNASYNFDLPYVIQGNNFSGFQFQSVVNWGDGSSSNAGGGISATATNIVMNPPLSHTYSAPGSYLITTTVYNPANQTSAIDTIAFTVGSCTYQVYAFVGLDCNNDGTTEQNLQNVPFQLVGTNGLFYQNNSLNTMLMFTGVPPGTYTLQIDPQWLAANGYQ